MMVFSIVSPLKIDEAKKKTALKYYTINSALTKILLCDNLRNFYSQEQIFTSDFFIFEKRIDSGLLLKNRPEGFYCTLKVFYWHYHPSNTVEMCFPH